MSESFTEAWARRFKRYGRSIRKRLGSQTIDDARKYVGTDSVSGGVQFQILKDEGLSPDHKVLEIGCGCVNAGAHVMEFLQPGHYVGIEPNEWLIETARKDPKIVALFEEKKPRFLHNIEFDASSVDEKYDLMLSHSILSHAAHFQLKQFLENTEKVLAPGGKICASIILAEGNSYGNGGSPDGEDSKFEEWIYPGISYFKKSTIEETAAEVGLNARYMPQYTQRYAAIRPAEMHDWFVFERR